jgi:hypothetical protein
MQAAVPSCISATRYNQTRCALERSRAQDRDLTRDPGITTIVLLYVIAA